jgi:C_GCAxxG_C_C family probable redox protein
MEEVADMRAKTERALAYFSEKFNCAQAVLGAFAEDYDLDAESALRLAGGLGMGVRRGEICGAASGAALVVGLKYGQYLPGDEGAKANCAAKTAEFMEKFRARNGALRCAELLGVDVTAPDAKARIDALNLHNTVCTGLIESAVALLEEAGY